jgi:general secretion pathway protein A
MYKEFYGLSRNPFELSPNPFFFYPTSRHAEALATLTYGVMRRKGFVVVTGEVGTGKTLLVRCLFDSLTQNKIAFAYIYNPIISVPEFLIQVIDDLGISSPATVSKRDALARLNSYLVKRSSQDQITALVVDEAQLLSWELLEEIRLLTNLETNEHKLLQIVLLGQPEFERKLDSPELRQLKQRVGLRCTLRPLDSIEIKGYIQQRLKLAGGNSRAAAIFPDETITLIQQVTLGIPRLINTVCESSLLLGFWHQQPHISWEIVLEAAADLRLNFSTEVFSTENSDVKFQRGVKSK